jgi:hypothetical protein
MVKVKDSRNRPGVAQRVPGGLGSQISWHSAREGGEAVSFTHRPPLTSGTLLVFISTRGWVDPRAMELSEGDTSLKNPVTPPGIDPGTVRLVAQGLNHYTTPSPMEYGKGKGKGNPVTGPEGPIGWVEVQLNSFLTSALEGGVWLTSRPGRLYPRERPGTHCTGGWVGPGAGLDRWGKSCPTGIRSPDLPARSESLYRLSYHGSVEYGTEIKFIFKWISDTQICLKLHTNYDA